MKTIKKMLGTTEATIFVRSNELKRRNIIINGKRTSVTLEPQIWSILHEVAAEHECTIHDLCDWVFNVKAEKSSLASAIRVFLISYLNIKCTQK
ncbi:MAG: ribbon-helix-helix domain-containing protein [Bdellovibrionales bacterium]